MVRRGQASAPFEKYLIFEMILAVVGLLLRRRRRDLIVEGKREGPFRGACSGRGSDRNEPNLMASRIFFKDKRSSNARK